jgi:hypothetical protein
MANKTISQLPAAGSADPNAVVAADNAAGTLTEKVTLQQIADLAGGGGSLPTGTNDQDVLTWGSGSSTWSSRATQIQQWDGSRTYSAGDLVWHPATARIWRSEGGPPGAEPGPESAYWFAITPPASGGNPFDQELNTVDSPDFSGMTVGTDGVTFDTTGCVIQGDNTAGVKISYQGTQKFGFYCDPTLSPGEALKFPDGTLQTTAYTGGGGGGGITAVYNKLAEDTTTDSTSPGEGLLTLQITEGIWTLTGLLIAYDPNGSGDASIGAFVTTNDSNITGAFAGGADAITANQLNYIENWQAVAITVNPGDTFRRYIPFSALIVCTEATDTVLLNFGDYSGDGDTLGMGAGSWMAAVKVAD